MADSQVSAELPVRRPSLAKRVRLPRLSGKASAAWLVVCFVLTAVLIPIALRGASFRPATAVELLRRNLVLYGLGGLVSAFVGIKLLYVLLAYVQGLPNVAAFGAQLHHLLGAL